LVKALYFGELPLMDFGGPWVTVADVIEPGLALQLDEWALSAFSGAQVSH